MRSVTQGFECGGKNIKWKRTVGSKRNRATLCKTLSVKKRSGGNIQTTEGTAGGGGRLGRQHVQAEETSGEMGRVEAARDQSGPESIGRGCPGATLGLRTGKEERRLLTASTTQRGGRKAANTDTGVDGPIYTGSENQGEMIRVIRWLICTEIDTEGERRNLLLRRVGLGPVKRKQHTCGTVAKE